MGISLDTTELRTLATQLGEVPAGAESKIRPVLSRAGLNMKRQLIHEMESSKHFKGFKTITYDLLEDGDGLGVEAGPLKGTAGAGANIAYFGTSRGGGTVPDPVGALEAEAPNFEKYLSDIMTSILGG